MALIAIHPGEHLAEELQELNMSAAELARKIAVPTNRVTQILNGRDLLRVTQLFASPIFLAQALSSGSICRVSTTFVLPREKRGAHGPRAVPMIVYAIPFFSTGHSDSPLNVRALSSART